MRMCVALMVLASLGVMGCANSEPGFCGDGLCRPSEGESSLTCSVDCMAAGCGDGSCSPGNGESCANCPSDCGGCSASCGDGTCEGSESCASCPGDCGMCSTTCGPTNCAGCCSGNTCLAGSATNACGGGGGICLDCGSGTLCEGSACAVDPASRWNILVDSYELSSSVTGSAWDAFGGAPDPVLRVYSPTESTLVGTVNGPDDVFSSSFASPRPAGMNLRADALLGYLEFRMLDEDVSDFEFVGACLLNGMVPEAFGGRIVTSVCPRDASTLNSGFEVRWHLERF